MTAEVTRLSTAARIIAEVEAAIAEMLEIEPIGVWLDLDERDANEVPVPRLMIDSAMAPHFATAAEIVSRHGIRLKRLGVVEVIRMDTDDLDDTPTPVEIDSADIG